MIYKYLSPERTQALRNSTLRATQANALNDPFEIKPFFTSVVQRNELIDRVREKGLFEEALKKTFSELPPNRRPPISPDQLALFLKINGVKEQLDLWLGAELDQFFDENVPAITENLRDHMHNKLGHMVGIVSFSENPAHQLMWAHYADSHRGFVLGFDEAHQFFDRRRGESDDFFHLRHVEYLDPLPVYSSVSQLDGAKILCVKHADWSYEQEKRILVPLPDGTDLGSIHLVNFPADALKMVILGERTPKLVESEIREILSVRDYAHVTVHRARVDYASGAIRLDMA